MTRAEFLRACSRSLGRPVPAHTALYAIRTGRVPIPKRRPDGWLEYRPAHVKSLVAYCRQRSGRSRVSRSRPVRPK